jgi:hypothetical protein
MAAEVMNEGCVTGDRINGLCDGVSGDWYCKFDTYHPAVNNGLPVTRVISRVTLQQILAKYAEKIGGPGVIQGQSKVVEFSEDSVQGKDRVRGHFKLPGSGSGSLTCCELELRARHGCHSQACKWGRLDACIRAGMGSALHG